MSILLFWAALYSVAAVDVLIAPDQPLSHVYFGEPLIVELLSNEDTTAEAKFTIRSSGGEVVATYDSGAVALRAGKGRWCVLDDVVQQRGHYTLEAEVVVGADTTHATQTFCRIDRPTDDTIPISGYAQENDAKARGAMKHAGVSTLRLDAGTPELEARVARTIEEGFSVVLRINAGDGYDLANSVRRLSDAHCSSVVRWEVSVEDSVDIEQVSAAFRQSGCRVPWAAVVPDAQTFQGLLDSGLGDHTRMLVLSGAQSDVGRIHRLAAEYGFESWDVFVSDSVYDDSATLRVGPRLLRDAAEGIVATEIDSRRVYEEGILGSALPELRAVAALYTGEAYVGDVGESLMGSEGQLQAPVFRDKNAWFMALWTETEAESLVLDLKNARALVHMDAFGNKTFESMDPLGAPLKLLVSAMPTYLRGEGGPVIVSAAEQEIQRRAQDFVEDATFQQYLTQAHAVVSRLSGDSPTINRAIFLEVIRLFPPLERGWVRGEMPRNVVVPALKNLAHIARALCVLEQSRQEPFLEPLSDTLRRCEAYQSQYLTGSAAAAAGGRGEWLMTEIQRYMDEATALAAVGRRIEASALASLAEWRARALEHLTVEGDLREWVLDLTEDIAGAEPTEEVAND
jgi:hypothetical protein